MNQQTRRIIKMHKKGYSVKEISSELKAKPINIRKILSIYKLRTYNLGLEICSQTVRFLEKRLANPVRQTLTNPYQIKLNGEKISVKCASKPFKQIHTFSYKFQLQDNSRHTIKNIQQDIDKLLLVFLDKPHKPIYEIETGEITAKYCISIPADIEKSKYHLRFIGYLEA